MKNDNTEDKALNKTDVSSSADDKGVLNGKCNITSCQKPLLSDVFVVKYENEIDELLKDLLYDESWMDDEDYKEVIEETFKIMGITKQKLSDDIEIGVKNGYTVEQQIVLLKRVLNVA